MTVTIGPPDHSRMIALTRTLRWSRGSMFAAGIGSLGLVAFAYGAFAFFGDLADPRARMPLPRIATVAMPAFENGLPVARPAQPAPAAPELARPAAPIPAEAAPPDAATVPRPAAESAGFGLRASERPARTPPPIENAAIVQSETQHVPTVAPLRLSKPIAPDRSESVRARLSGDKTAAPLRVPNADVVGGARKQTATKLSKEPAKERVARAVPRESAPETQPPAPAATRKAEPEDDDLATKLTNGIKAIGGILPLD